MRLDFDDDQLAIRDAISAALKSADADRLREIWGTGWLSEEFHTLGTMGMLGLALGADPESGGGPVESCLLAEQLGRHEALMPVLTSVVQAGALLRDAERLDAAAAATQGDSIWAFAHLEAGRRPQQSPQLQLTSGAGGLILRGEKAFVEWASLAQRFVVSCEQDGRANLVVVPVDAAGVAITRRVTSTGGELSRVTFADVAVPADDVLASGVGADELISAAVRRTLLFQSAYLLGAGERALELTVAHANIRQQFGRPLGAFQAVKQSLADTRIALTAARLMVYETASRAGVGSPLALLASTKAWVAEAVSDALRVAHEIHGGIGAVDNHEVSLLFRRGLAESHLWGSPSQLWQLAAERRVR